MTKHTLGEWCISPRRYRIDDNTVVISVRGWSEIALVLLDVQGSRSREEGWANARLIAAAPTMYEYIASSASNGCAEARKIMEAINAGR